jgi:hypothetical protein
VAEACRKSALVWLTPPGSGRAVPAWHVWHDGAVHVVHEGLEQPLGWLAGSDHVTVTVRSKDKGGRLVSFVARVTSLEPASAPWDAVVPELHASRLNPPDGEEQPLRWARESRVTRLEPTGELVEQPGDMPDGSLAATPAVTRATTLGRLPFVLGRRRGKRSAS